MLAALSNLVLTKLVGRTASFLVESIVSGFGSLAASQTPLFISIRWVFDPFFSDFENG